MCGWREVPRRRKSRVRAGVRVGSGNATPYLLALAAAVGGGLAYKSLAGRKTPKDEVVAEKKAPEVKKEPEVEEAKPMLNKPDEEVVTERGSSRPPRQPEEVKTPVKEKPLDSQRESELSPEPVDSPDLKVMEDIFMDSIQKIIGSNQIKDVEDFRELKNTGKISWRKTHFVFVVDCSGSMRGTRWESVKFGLKTCLNRMKMMEEIRISGFTFDDEVHDFCREVTPEEAIKLSKNMFFSAKGTDYIAALEHTMEIISNAEHKDYLACVMFLSDGLGGLPEDTIEHLKEMKRKGTKMLFYTIACDTEDDDDMATMSTNLGGEHYKVTNSEASKIVYTKILEV
eukprot:TRINITY_DN1422_c0_g1_i17.p1 TRINITY_DN1422_c0_g1~~TRINITY_DN1422_c0_g1_i17.p1  ORF type:complete len:341 (+),score=107.58 TRINITY_DN1422_c0_g1_i17:650-1672(+)